MATGLRSYRPLITGSTHMMSSGHYLATAGGYRILEEGGNAVDAGVAAGLALNVVLPQYTSFGGVAPMIVHHAGKGETVSIAGLGRWPRTASADYFNRHCNGELPPGVLRTVTPAAADAWLTALKRYGTMTFTQVAAPALELAEQGFPVPHSLHRALTREGDRLAHDEGETSRWAENMAAFYPGGKALQPGQTLVQKDLARTFRRLAEVEQASASRGREEAIQAARDFFYRGDIAHEMVRFCQEQGGLLSLEDLAEYHSPVEQAPSVDYKGTQVYACGPWCQGPVILQALNILEAYDLAAMDHNSADYLHTVIGALELAFADRHAYYGDPDFVDVPMDGLLHKEYAALRRGALDSRRASGEMPEPGNPWPYQGRPGSGPTPGRPEPVAGRLEADTSYVCAVDRWGNAFSATPSDGIGGAPVAPGLGFVISPRGSQTWLDPQHPCALEPGKRPRLTPNPALAFKEGRAWMPFGTPGGDVQCQSMVQLFLNVAEFGMDVQQAVEAPRASTWSFPNSFWPHAYHPGLVGLEGRMAPETVAELQRRGHRVEVWDDWTPRMGSLSAIEVDQQGGALFGAADLRRDSYAIGR